MCDKFPSYYIEWKKLETSIYIIFAIVYVKVRKKQK